MSTINFKICSLLIFLFASAACTEKSADSTKGFAELSNFSYHGAGQRNLGLKFILKGESTRTITAVVALPEFLDFKNQKVKFRWQLDSGVNVVDGNTTGEINLNSNEKIVKVKITVKDFSTEVKKFVRFEASSDVANGNKKSRFFIDGIVSSQSESSFENFVQGIENYKKKVHYTNEK
jgi:uncharacterized protein YdgA (DUF945 family)